VAATVTSIAGMSGWATHIVILYWQHPLECQTLLHAVPAGAA